MTRERKFPDAVRRNWGYWDAVADKRDHFVPMWRRGPVDRHYDKVYVAGYYDGMNAEEESK